ncbi:MAG: bifunctional phosphoribosyl-AMP cyclohydrolase/phosphoribosyl-ATP diphosphatase HisIE [Myxococcales bacterium]|nr:bifunctional phosphoribosyl-AMP cyclohydrolase/phosphoribosyl-ATP diphosphatase HisIE [Myxococcales bacterium]
MSARDLPLKLDDRGLVPVVVLDESTGSVRMLAWADVPAIDATIDTGKATFFSRSRGKVWVKGETSGNTIAVREVRVDCDGDAVLYVGRASGPSCHTGEDTCFYRTVGGEGVEEGAAPQAFLERLAALIHQRRTAPVGKSYVRTLCDGGAPAIGAKVREEADELARAVEGEDDGRVVSEAADLLFHALVGLEVRGVALSDVVDELARRFGTSGLDEKRRRPVS